MLIGLMGPLGCAKVDRDFGLLETGGAGGAAGGGGAGGVPACAQGTYGTADAPLLSVSTLDRVDDFSLSCGNGTAPDVAVFWTAPASGWYSLNTAGSAFDTVLGLFEPVCGGAERACNNDIGARPDSEIVRSFARDESVLVVIDGNYGAQGLAVLNVEPVTCPATDLTDQPLPAHLTTVGATNRHTGSCGGEAEPEQAYRYVPPADGWYRFSVSSSEIRPALYLERGAKCGGELLGCNATDGGNYQATVSRWLRAGQPVTLIVDSQGGSGAFTLNAVKSNDACPAVPPPAPLERFGVDNAVLDAAAPDLLSPSCQPAASLEFYGATHEHTYGLEVALSPFESCQVYVESDAPVTVYMLEGDRCDGREVPGSCRTSTCTGTECQTFLSLGPDGSYVVVVEAAYGLIGRATYTMHMACTLA